MAQDSLHDCVDEQRRHIDALAAHQAEVIGLQRPGRKQSVAESQKHRVIGTRICVLQRAELLGADCADWRRPQQLVQVDFRPAGFGQQSQFRQVQEQAQIGFGRFQPALRRQLEMNIAAGRPEVTHQRKKMLAPRVRQALPVLPACVTFSALPSLPRRLLAQPVPMQPPAVQKALGRHKQESPLALMPACLPPWQSCGSCRRRGSSTGRSDRPRPCQTRRSWLRPTPLFPWLRRSAQATWPRPNQPAWPR